MKNLFALVTLLFSFSAMADLTYDKCSYPRIEGTVVRYFKEKGYGHLKPSDGSQEVFVHMSAVESAGWDSLNVGQCVSFQILPGLDGREFADCLETCSEDAIDAN